MKQKVWRVWFTTEGKIPNSSLTSKLVEVDTKADAIHAVKSMYPKSDIGLIELKTSGRNC